MGRSVISQLFTTHGFLSGLVLGTAVTYAIQPEGNPWLLFGGVALGVIAILCNSRVYQVQTQEAAETKEMEAAELLNEEQTKQPPKPSFVKGLSICIVGGIFLGFYPVLYSKSMIPGHGNVGPRH